MYLADGAIERSALRQGDIISNIHILGAINLIQVTYTTTAANPEDQLNWCVPKPPDYADAMILSHSCEISTENGIKFTSIILAPIRDINTATDPSKIEQLIKSNLIDKDSPEHSFLKYFYLSENPNFVHKSGAVVDFSKCFSVRKNSYEHVLSRKIAQLTPETVQSMSLKLALYFHRRNGRDAA